MSRCYICNKRLENTEVLEDKHGPLPCTSCRASIRDTLELFDNYNEDEVIRLSSVDYEIFLEATEGRRSDET
jgi:hypothetical protein